MIFFNKLAAMYVSNIYEGSLKIYKPKCESGDKQTLRNCRRGCWCMMFSGCQGKAF